MPGNPHPSLPPGRGKGCDSCAEERLGEAQHRINDGANQYNGAQPQEQRRLRARIYQTTARERRRGRMCVLLPLPERTPSSRHRSAGLDG
jgi:hypothetical protein